MFDDHLTIRPIGGVRGMSSKPKAAVQALLAIAFVMWLATNRAEGFLPVLVVAGRPVLSGIAYWVFAVVFIVGMTNFVNITDGLDGLVSGLVGIAALALIACIMLLPGGARGECDLTLYALLSAIAGACVAFLWFNANPAKVFMGDTGSMALGAALPAIAILTHREVLLIVVGLVFVLDGLSSALQWAVFKYTRVTTGTGRRVFKKSPVHHHLELSGWPEQTVVARFWIMGVLAALIGFAGAVWQLW
jgi:phospho-N-acetylmuramoyl-pentapeptide-transferase